MANSRPIAFRVVCVLLGLCLPFLAKAGAAAGPERTIQSTTEALASFVGRQNGWSPNLTKLSGVSFEDAKVRHVLTYDVGLRVKGHPKEFSFSEDITPWNYLVPALPHTSSEEHTDAKPKGGQKSDVVAPSVQEQGLALLEGSKGQKKLSREEEVPTLPPFVLEGPIQLWIEGVTHLRLAMPHDVDAGDVKRVVLAAGAAVTVVGCQEVSLARPLQLPLPISQEDTGNRDSMFGPLSLFELAARLRRMASTVDSSLSGSKQLLALRIVRPTAIVAASPTPTPPALPPPEKQIPPAAVVELNGDLAPAVVPRMKVKRLSSSSVELQLRDVAGGAVEKVALSATVQSVSAQQHQARLSLWPFAFHNASEAKLSGFQQALLEALGDAAHRSGTFQLIRARAAVQRLVSIPFMVELQTEKRMDLQMMLSGGRQSDGSRETGSQDPKPFIRQQWEVLLQESHGGDLQPVRLKPLDSVQPTVLIDPGLVVGNISLALAQERVPRAQGLSL